MSLSAIALRMCGPSWNLLSKKCEAPQQRSAEQTSKTFAQVGFLFLFPNFLRVNDGDRFALERPRVLPPPLLEFLLTPCPT